MKRPSTPVLATLACLGALVAAAPSVAASDDAGSPTPTVRVAQPTPTVRVAQPTPSVRVAQPTPTAPVPQSVDVLLPAPQPLGTDPCDEPAVPAGRGGFVVADCDGGGGDGFVEVRPGQHVGPLTQGKAVGPRR